MVGNYVDDVNTNDYQHIDDHNYFVYLWVDRVFMVLKKKKNKKKEVIIITLPIIFGALIGLFIHLTERKQK